MAQKNATFAAIDVGTTKVCAIIGRGSGPDDVQVLAHSTVPCDGLRKGNVADSQATAEAIRRAVMDVSREADVTVDAAYVGVTGAHVSFENRWDALDWVGNLGVITADDLKRVPEKISIAAAMAGRRVMHAIPLTYALDGEKSIRNPLGMHARNLEVETHVVSGNQSYLRRLVEAVESAGIEVKDLVFEPLAGGEAVLTAAEKQEGVALVDIGGGTTDIVVFEGGMVRYTGVVPVGGYQFTNDICQTYGTSYKDAEDAKLTHATTDLYESKRVEEISLAVEGRSMAIKVPHRDLCQLTRERAQELLKLIKVKLQEADVEDISKLRVVITGGTSNLPGLESLTQQLLTNRVRIGMPNGNGSIPGELKAPAYSTGVGLLLWAASRSEPEATVQANGRNGTSEPRSGGFASRFIARLKIRLSLNLF